MMASAKIASDYGAQILRGGAFKPRTSPYSFQGLGEEGLKLLREAGEEYEMPIITEVISVEDVALVSEYADILHKGDKTYLMHACGHLLQFGEMIQDLKLDGLVDIATPPTGTLNGALFKTPA